MRKLTLDVNALEVQSFEVGSTSGAGTVRGEQQCVNTGAYSGCTAMNCSVNQTCDNKGFCIPQEDRTQTCPDAGTCAATCSQFTCELHCTHATDVAGTMCPCTEPTYCTSAPNGCY